MQYVHSIYHHLERLFLLLCVMTVIDGAAKYNPDNQSHVYCQLTKFYNKEKDIEIPRHEIIPTLSAYMCIYIHCHQVK